MIINKYRKEENNMNENLDWIKYILIKITLKKLERKYALIKEVLV